MIGKDREEMASPEVVRHPTEEHPPIPVQQSSRLADLARFLPIFLVALIGALVVLRIVDGWVVLPLVLLEILLFVLIIRLWRPAAKQL
jgi:hypothetical protein